MAEEQIIEEIKKYNCINVLITGGEPALQDISVLCRKLKAENFDVFLETNGTLPLLNDAEKYIDWITMSPKGPVKIQVWREAKIIVAKDDTKDLIEKRIQCIKRTNYHGMIFLQPCWDKTEELTKLAIQKTVELVKEIPECRLSLQSQKLINIK